LTENDAPRGVRQRLGRLLRRARNCLRQPHPLAELISLAAEHEVRWPAYVIAQNYAAWQAARVPSWENGRFRLRFHWRALKGGCSALWRSVAPGGPGSFHEVKVRQPPRAGAPEVLHVIPTLLVGGSQKVLFDLVEELGHAYRMRVLTGWLPHFGRYPGLDVTVARTVEAVAKDLRERPPALIHLHYLGMEPFTRTFLDALERLPEMRAPILENNNMPVQALAHPRVAHCVHVSRYAMDLQSHPAGAHSVIYPGVSPEHFPPRPAQRPAGPPTVGMVYRLATEKLNLASIEPFIEVARRMPEARILIVGEGLYLAPYVARVKDAGVRAQFHFAGRLSYRDLPACYDRMDVFLAPVYEESYGVVVPYALCKGVPVLAYRVGALPEMLGEADCFCADAQDMAARAVGLLKDPESARRLGARLRERAGRFSLAGMAAAYDRLYTSLLRPTQA